MGINDLAIELLHDQKLPYAPIYNLNPIELKILKIYIKNNLANSFIKFSKSLAIAVIFFDKKPNRNLQFLIDY